MPIPHTVTVGPWFLAGDATCCTTPSSPSLIYRFSASHGRALSPRFLELGPSSRLLLLLQRGQVNIGLPPTLQPASLPPAERLSSGPPQPKLHHDIAWTHNTLSEGVLLGSQLHQSACNPCEQVVFVSDLSYFIVYIVGYKDLGSFEFCVTALVYLPTGQPEQAQSGGCCLQRYASTLCCSGVLS